MEGLPSSWNFSHLLLSAGERRGQRHGARGHHTTACGSLDSAGLQTAGLLPAAGCQQRILGSGGARVAQWSLAFSPATQSTIS